MRALAFEPLTVVLIVPYACKETTGHGKSEMTARHQVRRCSDGSGVSDSSLGPWNPRLHEKLLTPCDIFFKR